MSASARLQDHTTDLIRNKIIAVLSVYPKLNPTMLQVGLGTSLSTSLWKPILNQMIKDGVVLLTSATMTNPNGRQHAVTILSLAEDKRQAA